MRSVIQFNHWMSPNNSNCNVYMFIGLRGLTLHLGCYAMHVCEMIVIFLELEGLYQGKVLLGYSQSEP